MCYLSITPILSQCYIVFVELEHKKKQLDPDAKVCSHLSNHEIFEKWRAKDVTKLGMLEMEEYEQDKRESSRRYYSAWYNTAARTMHSSFRAFWKPFGIEWNPGMLPSDDMDGEGCPELEFAGRESAFDMGMRDSGLDDIYEGSTIDNNFRIHNPMARTNQPPANIDGKRWRSASTGATVDVPAYQLDPGIAHEAAVDVPSNGTHEARAVSHPSSNNKINQQLTNPLQNSPPKKNNKQKTTPALPRQRLSTLDGGFFEHQVSDAAHDHDLQSWHSSSTGAKVKVELHHAHAGIGHRAAEVLHKVEHAAAGALHKAEHAAVEALHKVEEHAAHRMHDRHL
jgi:hypothetical protein